MSELKAEGVRKSILNELNNLKGTAMEEGRLLDETVLKLLTDTTLKLNREVLLMLDDHNVIHNVALGDVNTVAFGDAKMETTAIGLNRIRVIHTHPGGNPHLSDEDLSAAVRQRLQCMVAVGVAPDGTNRFGIGLPMVEDESLVYRYALVDSLRRLNALDVAGYAALASRELRRLPGAGFDTVDTEERALLLGVDLGTRGIGIDLASSMEELRRLVETADGRVVDVVTQSRSQIDPVFYLGKGKLREIVRLVQNADANLIVANDELNSNQIACIESLTGCKTIDRTTIILDIFARHAKTREGKLQVELAQQKYRMSHLKGLGIVLSRTGGGIGTRGPGEKKLETDRRHIRRQIDELLSRLERIDKSNALGAKQRTRNQIRTVALVGYTNSGKSTLFNRLTDSDVVMQDGLFITLDSTMRQINPEYGNYLLSDTVGFIEKLPHDLVTAFRTTLKEVDDADLLLHVVDAAGPHAQAQMAVVDEVLGSIGAGHQDILVVYNKIDLLDEASALALQNRAEREGAVCISAREGEGTHTLTAAISAHLGGGTRTRQFLIPYTHSKVLAALHEKAEVTQMDYVEMGTQVTAITDKDFPSHRFEAYEITEEDHGTGLPDHSC
ncbi:GTPase HflX [Eubacterium sp.]|uniref:GTPase HflX n=1 Tax=Eubacterium sp. TaxID=142586 RepID=UPI002FC5F34B